MWVWLVILHTHIHHSSRQETNLGTHHITYIITHFYVYTSANVTRALISTVFGGVVSEREGGEMVGGAQGGAYRGET